MNKLLTKSKYLAGLQCDKLLWNLLNKPEIIPPPSDDALARMSAGSEIGVLATKMFPEGVDLSVFDFDLNLSETKIALNAGKTIFEAGFKVDNLFARIDILCPNEDGSVDIIEVKSSNKIKEENIHDVSFQKYVLEQTGLNVDACFICHVNKEFIKEGDIDLEEFFVIEEVTDRVIEAQKGILGRIEDMFKIINLQNPPKVEIGSHCKKPYPCGLKNDCWSFLPDNNVFELYRGGEKSVKLMKENILRIKDIPADFKLTNNQQVQLNCAVSGQENIQKTEIKQFLDSLIYPLYHLDFETINPSIPIYDGMRPAQRIPFQFSLHIEQEDGRIEHKEFLANGPRDQRKDFLEALKEYLGRAGSIVVYNESFEKGCLKELANNFPDYKEFVNELMPRIIDLLVPFRNFHYYNQSQKGSASIKAVLPALTNLSYKELDINNGMIASNSFEKITYDESVTKEEIKQVRADLLEYCKLDTWAEVELIRKLKILSKVM